MDKPKEDRGTDSGDDGVPGGEKGGIDARKWVCKGSDGCEEVGYAVGLEREEREETRSSVG